MRRTVLIVTAAAASAASAQTDPLYASSVVYTHELYKIGGGALLASAPEAGTDQGGLAVWGDIRTTGLQSGAGGRYDLSLNYQNTAYPFTGTAQRFDGTSDGTYNYAFAYTSHSVYRYDRNWQNETLLCNLPSVNNVGITYDTSSGRFWGYSLSGTDTIFNFDSSGTVYSTFQTDPSVPFQYGLAYEPSTGTLWTISNGFGQDPYLTQYTTGGTKLQQFQVPNLTDENITGLEFDLVPAPGSVGLLGLAGLVSSRRRRA